MIKKYLFLFFVFITALTFSQVKVSGKVIDESGSPIPFANIVFKGSTIGTVSDENGSFYLESKKTYKVLEVAFLGYKKALVPLKAFNYNIKVTLKEASSQLNEVMIYTGKVKKKGNPAIAILKKIWAKRRRNGIYLYKQYQFDKYEKIEFDLNNVDDKLKHSKLFRGMEFVFDKVDTSNITGKPYLPIFINEAIYKTYGKNSTIKKFREDLIANKNSGFGNNQNLIAFVKDLYVNYNVYDNYIKIFDKSFTSPVSRTGPSVYNYVLADSSFIDNKWCYNIVYYPRRKNELTFKGNFWVNDTTFAIKSIKMQANKSANINWVKDLYLEQKFDVVNDSVFLLKRDYIMSDFALRKKEKSKGIYGRRITLYSNYNFKEKKKDDFYTKKVYSYNDSVYDRSDDYWAKHRLEDLNKNQKGIYKMLDTLKTVKKFKNLYNLTATLYSGYWQILKGIDYGPIFSSFGTNDVEGTRIRVGARTYLTQSDKYRLQGFLAYGTKDHQFKYGFAGKLLLDNKNRFIISAGNRRDVEQTGVSLTTVNDVLNRSFASAAFFTRGNNFRLTKLNLSKISLAFEPLKNVNFKLSGTYKTLRSAAPNLFNVDYFDKLGNIKSIVNQSEVDLSVRFTPKRKTFGFGVERGIINEGKYPTLFLSYTQGIRGLLNSDFNYKKLQFYYRQPFQLGAFGRLTTTVEVGKTFNAVPLTLLDVVPGNQTLFTATRTFDLLDYYEFVTDQYASFHLENNFNGRLFSRVPGLRKLNLRAIIGIRGVVGTISDKNKAINASSLTYRAPTKMYYEYHFGVGNILKLLRIDFVFRGDYKNIPGATKFAVKGGIGFYF